jgi:potassium channel subfamily K protein 9
MHTNYVYTLQLRAGYGHMAPKTSVGKMICLLYAAFGVPLNLLTFGLVGERLNHAVSFALVRLKRQLRLRLVATRFRFRFPMVATTTTDSDEVTQTDLTAAVAGMAVVLLVWGAWGFSYFENWSYMDSFYYCVITLTTIGENS